MQLFLQVNDDLEYYAVKDKRITWDLGGVYWTRDNQRPKRFSALQLYQ